MRGEGASKRASNDSNDSNVKFWLRVCVCARAKIHVTQKTYNGYADLGLSDTPAVAVTRAHTHTRDTTQIHLIKLGPAEHGTSLFPKHLTLHPKPNPL